MSEQGRVRGHLIVSDHEGFCDACSEIYRRGETIIEVIDPDEYFHRKCGGGILLPGSFGFDEEEDR